MTGERPSFYALEPGGWRDYWSLLHVPYTLWHLGYVAIGAALVPVIDPYRFWLSILAFFLAVGIAAHALDELHGRPLRTRIPTGVLLGLAAFGLAGALALGFYGCSLVSWWGLPFMALGGFVVPAYGLEWFRGRFHNEAWFAGMWGAFPALAGYFAQTGRIGPVVLVVCVGCAALTAAQRRLSTPVRRLRRHVLEVRGELVQDDGAVEALDAAALRAAPEGALRMLWIGVVALAVGLAASRWP